MRLRRGGRIENVADLRPSLDGVFTSSSSDGFKRLLLKCIEYKCLDLGREVHAQIIETGLDVHITVRRILLNMYIKCGSMGDAHGVFMSEGPRDVIMWNAIIAGFCKNGLPGEAIRVFWEISEFVEKPNDVTYLSVFKACGAIGSYELGITVHSDLIERGVELNDYGTNTLIDMYAKCGSLPDAEKIFATIVTYTVVSLNVMISGFALYEQYDKVFSLFGQMRSMGMIPDDYTLVIVLRACVDAEALFWGRHIHDHIIRSGAQPDVYVANSLITLYAKCKSIQDAHQVFRSMTTRDLISWNAMIGAFIFNCQNKEALELFQVLIQQDLKPDQATFISSLKACVSLKSLDMGNNIYTCLIESGLNKSILLLATLVDMYAKCGSIRDARKVFDTMEVRNLVVWNTVISGYSQNLKETAKLFNQMMNDGFKPDEVTFLSLLKACSNQPDIEHCRLINELCVESGCETQLYVGSSLVDVYATSGSLQDALEVLLVMPERNNVSWNALIRGCVDQGSNKAALEHFHHMITEGIHPDEITYVNIINACASLADLEQGKCAHGRLLFDVIVPNIFVGNALVDMYGKCGGLTEALKAFRTMREQDIVSWNALISAYAQHGLGKQVLRFAEEMQKLCVKFNNITIVALLTAFSHTGMVEEAQRYFDSMQKVHGIVPTTEHYACMVDVLGRAGLIDAAVRFIRNLPIEPTSVVWMALLGACRLYGCQELASYSAEQILATEPENSAAFLLASGFHGEMA